MRFGCRCGSEWAGYRCQLCSAWSTLFGRRLFQVMGESGARHYPSLSRKPVRFPALCCLLMASILSVPGHRREAEGYRRDTGMIGETGECYPLRYGSGACG